MSLRTLSFALTMALSACSGGQEGSRASPSALAPGGSALADAATAALELASGAAERSAPFEQPNWPPNKHSRSQAAQRFINSPNESPAPQRPAARDAPRRA